jgi:hypothetical protein
MRETLAVCKVISDEGLRVEAIEALMLQRGMKARDAARRLERALELAAGAEVWDFALAWEIGWRTIYWPHNTRVRNLEKDCLTVARGEFELAWYGRPTKLEHLRAALEALDDARDETAGYADGVELVA